MVNKLQNTKLIEETLKNISKMTPKEKEILCVCLTRSMYGGLEKEVEIAESWEKERKEAKERKEKPHQKALRRNHYIRSSLTASGGSLRAKGLMCQRKSTPKPPKVLKRE